MFSIIRNSQYHLIKTKRSFNFATQQLSKPKKDEKQTRIQVVTKAKQECTEEKKESYCNVTILGADSNIGALVSFLIKQNPLITGLHLQGGARVIGMAKDLEGIDTTCRVHAHDGDHNQKNALKTADIVVLLGRDSFSKQTTLGDRVMVEGDRVCRLTKMCTSYAPKAVLLVCVKPVSIMVPLVVEMFKLTHWYHPARIVGFTSCIPIVCNTAVAKHQCFDPQIVDVPLIGGPDIDSIVPVFSRASPCPLDERGALSLTAQLRGVDAQDFPRIARTDNTIVICRYPEAVAINRLVSAIALGIHGDEAAVACAHVRYSAMESCRFLTTQVRFGKGGVVHNYGVPSLSYFEQDLLERSTAVLSEKEKIAQEYFEYFMAGKKDKLPNFKQKEINESCKRQLIKSN